MKYNDKLTPFEQIDMEEEIAAHIFHFTDSQSEGFGEEACAQLGRAILLRVLTKFRPDLVTE